MRRLRVQLNSIKVVQWVKGEGEGEPHANQIEACKRKDMVQRDWEIQVHHIHREGNHVADSLAKLALNFQSQETRRWSSPPEGAEV